MKNSLLQSLKSLISHAYTRRTVRALAVLVVFFTTYMLILPAFTLEKDEAVRQGGIDIGTTSAELSDADAAADAGDAAENNSGADMEPEDESYVYDSGSDFEASSDEDADTDDENASADSDAGAIAGNDAETGESYGDAAEDAAAESQDEAEAVSDPDAQNEDAGAQTAAPLTFEGDGFTVSVDDTHSVLPGDTQLAVEELIENPTEGTKAERRERMEAYKAYCDQAIAAINEESKSKAGRTISFAKLYDISLQSSGEEITPDKPVDVTISYDKKARKDLKVDEAADVRIIHFAQDEKTEEVTAELIDEDAVDVTLEKSRMAEAAFEAESFSVYAVIYTVDFHYDVNGKKYDFSIPGGGYASLADIVEVLGIAQQDGTDSAAAEEISLDDVKVSEETWTFMEDIKDAAFSDPSLVWVGRADKDTTIGDLKSENGLEIEYAADLTGEQIRKFDETEIRSGDWAIISLKPFTSDERLTVTMKNGDQWIVDVTDLVYGAFGHDVRIDIIGNGGIELTEYVADPYSFWDDEERVRTYFSARTVPLSLSYFYYNPGNSTAGNNHEIIAHPGEGYVFDHWEKNGERLTGQAFASETIAPGALYLSYTIPDTLTAVFRKTSSGGGGSTIDVDDIIRQWTQDITNDQPVVDKTASVYNYKNRIYKIDITASSELYAVNRDMDIDFVTDVSRSMLFPSKLDPVKTFTNSTEFISQLDAATREYHNGYLPNSTDPGELYYIILQPQGASDVYVVRKYNGTWWRLPASKSDEEINAAVIRGGSYDVWRELNGHVADENGNVVITSLTYTYGHPVVDNKIYVATDETDRLEYLKQALNLVKQVLYKVDPDAKIGLTTFAKTADRGRFYSNTEQAALNTAIANITVDDNTDQAAGLAAGKALLDTETDNTRKKTIVLITDGAPNAPATSPYYPLDWAKIQAVAQGIKEAGVDIYTVGLSLENVQGASDGLFHTSSNTEEGKHGYAYDARDGLGLVEAVQSIIESIVVKASMTGSVTDTIDPAFYPVDKDGNPLQPDVEYEDEQGHKFKLTRSGETWMVSWLNQEFKWAYTDEEGVRQPGWKGTIYVKAKENFLGGNGIKTNSGTPNDKVTASGYKTIIEVDEDGNEVPGKSGPLKDENGTEKTVTKNLSTPYVNVDELALTQNSTEWKVYLGTEVDPKDQMKRLLSSIDIRKVVSGDTNEMITSQDQMLGGTGDNSKTIALTDYLGIRTEAQMNGLINELLIMGSKTYRYNNDMPAAYGHGYVGDIVITLADAAGCYNKDNHATEHTGKDAEYTLKVEYRPLTNPERNTGLGITNDDYHNGSGSAGESVPKTGNDMTSTNHHVIEVFKKGLKLIKVDMLTGEEIDPAEFTLSSPGKTDIVKTTVNSEVSFDPLEKPAAKSGGGYENYTLRETKAPVGYGLISEDLAVSLNIADSFTDPKTGAVLKDEHNEALTAPPPTGLYNWNETANLTISATSTGFYERVSPDGSADSENAVVTYKIKNNPGVELPHTGGIGTMLFYIFGSMLVVGCGVVLAARRRMNRRSE